MNLILKMANPSWIVVCPFLFLNMDILCDTANTTNVTQNSTSSVFHKLNQSVPANVSLILFNNSTNNTTNLITNSTSIFANASPKDNGIIEIFPLNKNFKNETSAPKYATAAAPFQSKRLSRIMSNYLERKMNQKQNKPKLAHPLIVLSPLNSNQTKINETKPIETKPIETKPIETQSNKTQFNKTQANQTQNTNLITSNQTSLNQFDNKTLTMAELVASPTNQDNQHDPGTDSEDPDGQSDEPEEPNHDEPSQPDNDDGDDEEDEEENDDGEADEGYDDLDDDEKNRDKKENDDYYFDD